MSQESGQFDFIISKKPVKDAGFAGSSNMRSRILIAGIAAVLLLVIGSAVFGFILRGNDKTIPDLIAVTQQQNELIRVAAIGVKGARSSTTQNYAITTQLSIQTDQAALLANMKASRHGVSEKDLNATKDIRIDATLTAAGQNNAFDETFIKTLKAQLETYRQAVKKAHDETTGKKTKQTLANCYTHATTILQGLAPTTRN